MKAWRIAALALLVLVVPSASAEPGTLVLSAAGDLALLDVSTLEMPVDAAFSSEASALSGFRIDCRDLALTAYELRTIPVGNVEVGSGNSHQPIRRANATTTAAQPSAEGWMGVYPAEPGTLLTLSDVGALMVHPASRSVLGNAPTMPEDEVHPERASFSAPVEEPHFTFNHTGRASLQGTFSLKISGVVLDVYSGQGAESFDLRSSAASPPSAPERVRRWAFLTCAEGQLTLEGGGDLQVASTRVTVAGAKSISAHAQDARLELVGSEGSAVDQAITVEGDLSGELTPTESEGVVLTSGILRGEVTAASIAIPVGSPGVSVLSRWPLFSLVLGAVLGGGAATYMLWKRAGTSLSVDQLVDLANQSAELGHYGAALEWIDQALARVPTHPRILADRAFFLGELGDTAGAIAGYEAAAAASQDGEAHLMLARLLVGLGDTDAAAGAVCSALERSPALVFEVLDDSALAGLRSAPSVARAIGRSKRSMEG